MINRGKEKDRKESGNRWKKIGKEKEIRKMLGMKGSRKRV